ncbi:MAG: co-chaperone GroES [Candidatus Eisenbacteria bacterium]|nr:co-chaperone GroES [Candidatus Eisenbacteria bacterium]
MAAKKKTTKKKSKKLNIKPLQNRVLVKRLEEELQKTAGGIIVPDTAKEKPQRGKVMAVGPGRMTDDGKRIDVEVEVGDEVLFGKWSGSEITIDGEEYLFMKDDDILAIL